MMQPQKPSVLTRFKAAIDFYRHGWRKFELVQQKAKNIPFIWPTWYNNQPQWQLIDYQAYVNEGFNANAIIYAAIMYKARASTLAPLRAYTGTEEQPELLPPENWLQQLCTRPNPFQSWTEFDTLNWVYWSISGNCYVTFQRQGDEITSMFSLRPDRTFIIPINHPKYPIGFWYVPEGRGWSDGVPYAMPDVMHVKLPNPGDPLDGLGYGISQISPSAHSIEVDNDLTKFFRLFFQSGAMPPGVLTYDVPMLDEDVSRARERWMEIYGGYENWKDVAVLDQGGRYERIGFTFAEMDVSAMDARNESRMVMPLGVPLTLIESRPQLVQSTYNNKESDKVQFWEDTMEPEKKWWESDWKYYLQGNDSFVMYDLSQTPAYQKRRNERLDRIQRAYEAGKKSGEIVVTAAEYRTELGFDPLPNPNDIDLDGLGDNTNITGQLSTNRQDKPSNLESTAGLNGAQIQAVLDVLERLAMGQVTALVATELLIAVGIDKDRASRIVNTSDDNIDAIELEQSKTNGDLKKKSIKATGDQIALDFELEFGDAAVDAFEQDLIYIQALINDTNREALENRASLNWDIVIEALAVYFAGAAINNWSRYFSLPLFELMTEQINTLNRQYGQTFPASELLSQEWFNEYTIQFAQPINATSEEQIRRIIEQGVNEGWSVPTMQNRIEQVFNQWMTGELTPEEMDWFLDRMPEYRREMIARTETMAGLNTVSYRLFGAWGVQEHQWQATHDNRVRSAHIAADGQVVRVGQPFNVGGEPLLYPGDPSGSPGNIINCRCTTVPIMR